MNHKYSSVDLDLSGQFCPMAFVKFRLYSDSLLPNTKFTVAFEQTPANEPLVRSIVALGYNVKEVSQENSASGRPPLKVIRVTPTK